jgi:NlpC/P60 family putative phage cell wall peptidase
LITRAAIVAEARTWLDTPFHHQGRLKGIGVDCAGVPEGVARAFGIPVRDIPADYGRQPDVATMLKALRANLTEKPRAEVAPGDVLWLVWVRHPQHLAIYTDTDTIIHAAEIFGRVVEHRYDFTWQRRCRGVFAFPGVE